MSLLQLLHIPRHLLAATIERGRERYPVRVKQLGMGHIVVGPLPIALRERARLTINCPLSDKACEVTAEAVRKDADSTWLSLVPAN
jgi:hypothetical protein